MKKQAMFVFVLTALVTFSTFGSATAQEIVEPNRLESDLNYTIQIAPTDSTNARQLILDPSFEAYSPNPFWNEYSAAIDSPLCNYLCGVGTGTGPRSGDIWAWFGGFYSGDTASLSQSVIIPAGFPKLSFWVEQVVCNGDGASNYLKLTIDDEEIWRTDSSDSACGVLGYRPVTLDVSNYADGGTHEIKFYSATINLANFFVDDVELYTGVEIFLPLALK